MLQQFCAALPLLVFLLLWQLAATLHIAPVQVLVPPTKVARTAVGMIRDGELLHHIDASLYRLLTGFLTGAFAGLAVGTSMALSALLRQLVAPLFQILRQVPIIAFLPLLILFFDVEDMFKIVAVALATFFPVALATFDGIGAIPRRYLDVAALYRLPPMALVMQVVLPAAVPSVLTGLRLGLTRAWLVLVGAELMAADSGLGQMMEMGRQMFRIDRVMIGVIVTGGIGFMLDRGAVAIERLLTRWERA